MKTLKRMLQSEAGQALPMALILLFMGGLFVVPSLGLSDTSLKANRIVDEADLRLYAADAGVEDMLWHIRYDDGFTLPADGALPQSLPQFSINGNTVNVEISKQAGQPYKITSTAGQTTVECLLDIIGSSDVWDYALASLGGDINLSGNSEIESDQVLGGDVYSNGNINVGGNAEVDGNASAVGDITVTANGDINGDEVEGVVPLVAPCVDTATYKAEAQNIGCDTISCGGTYYSQDLIISSNGSYPQVNVARDLKVQEICTVTFQDTVCVGRNLSISGITNVTFNGPVKVVGNVNLSNMGTVTFKDKVCITGNLSISSNSIVTFEGPVKVNGNISISTNNNVTFGDTVYVGGSVTVSSNTNISLGGTFYVYGGISVTGNANFIGGEYIFAETGNITLSGNSKLDSEDIPFIMAIHGDVTISGNNWTSAIIYAPEGQITLSGNCRLFGCAVGESVTGSGNSTVEYPMDLRDRGDLPGAGGGGGSGLGLEIRTYVIQ